jgi:hypothetical protein
VVAPWSEPHQKCERVEVEREGPVAERPLQDEAHEVDSEESLGVKQLRTVLQLHCGACAAISTMLASRRATLRPAPAKHIVAMGGGGFLMEATPALDVYILAQARKRCPRVCFVATASGDSADNMPAFIVSSPPWIAGPHSAWSPPACPRASPPRSTMWMVP